MNTIRMYVLYHRFPRSARLGIVCVHNLNLKLDVPPCDQSEAVRGDAHRFTSCLMEALGESAVSTP
jgi:hypothetical protein